MYSMHCLNATLGHQNAITDQIVIILGMCIESKFVKCMLKEVWLQMKFGEIFGGG